MQNGIHFCQCGRVWFSVVFGCKAQLLQGRVVLAAVCHDCKRSRLIGGYAREEGLKSGPKHCLSSKRVSGFAAKRLWDGSALCSPTALASTGEAVQWEPVGVPALCPARRELRRQQRQALGFDGTLMAISEW